MALALKPACEKCAALLPPEAGNARICSYECTFCANCADAMNNGCPNCGGELVPRPRRVPKAGLGNRRAAELSDGELRC